MNSLNQILSLLAKADRVGVTYTVSESRKPTEYEIDFRFTFGKNENGRVIETTETLHVYSSVDTDEYDMIVRLIDEFVNDKKEAERKKQQKKELLARLTDEEKELLGIQ